MSIVCVIVHNMGYNENEQKKEATIRSQAERNPPTPLLFDLRKATKILIVTTIYV